MIHFYYFIKTKTLLISDQPLEKVKSKYGYNFEKLNSVKDLSSVEIVKQRLFRSYAIDIVQEYFQKIKKPVTEEARRKMSLAKLGRKMDEKVKLKISCTMKGKSNFEGKRHNIDTKEKMAEKKLGNQHTKNTYWAYSSVLDKETRVRDRHNLPNTFLLGRDYYSVEPGLYEFKLSTTSPRDKQSS